jgi:hypothetical protein
MNGENKEVKRYIEMISEYYSICNEVIRKVYERELQESEDFEPEVQKISEQLFDFLPWLNLLYNMMLRRNMGEMFEKRTCRIVELYQKKLGDSKESIRIQRSVYNDMKRYGDYLKFIQQARKILKIIEVIESKIIIENEREYLEDGNDPETEVWKWVLIDLKEKEKEMLKEVKEEEEKSPAMNDKFVNDDSMNLGKKGGNERR